MISCKPNRTAPHPKTQTAAAAAANVTNMAERWPMVTTGRRRARVNGTTRYPNSTFFIRTRRRAPCPLCCQQCEGTCAVSINTCTTTVRVKRSFWDIEDTTGTPSGHHRDTRRERRWTKPQNTGEEEDLVLISCSNGGISSFARSCSFASPARTSGDSFTLRSHFPNSDPQLKDFGHERWQF